MHARLVPLLILLGLASAAHAELGPSEFTEECRDGQQPAAAGDAIACDSDALLDGTCTFGDAKSPVVRVPVGGTSKLPVAGKVGEFTCLSSASDNSAAPAGSDGSEGKVGAGEDDPRGKIVIMPSAEHPDARVGENPNYEMERFLAESGMRAYKPSRADMERLQRTLHAHE
jgi:hypothetical protein